MKISIIIESGDERFEVHFHQERPVIRTAAGIDIGTPGHRLQEHWDRLCSDAQRWVERRNPRGGSHEQEK